MKGSKLCYLARIVVKLPVIINGQAGNQFQNIIKDIQKSLIKHAKNWTRANTKESPATDSLVTGQLYIHKFLVIYEQKWTRGKTEEIVLQERIWSQVNLLLNQTSQINHAERQHG